MGIKASAIELLEVLIEESNENSNTLAQEIARDLSVEDITLTMEEIWVSIHWYQGSLYRPFSGCATPPEKHHTSLHYSLCIKCIPPTSHTC